MIVSACASFLALALFKDAAQSTTCVSGDGSKDIAFAVLEVLKPSSQSPAQILADRSHAPSVRTSGLGANPIFEFFHAFLARPFHFPFKMIAQEVEPSGFAGVYQPCFDRVQAQAV